MERLTRLKPYLLILALDQKRGVGGVFPCLGRVEPQAKPAIRTNLPRTRHTEGQHSLH
jgi:hypothetical protein